MQRTHIVQNESTSAARAQQDDDNNQHLPPCDRRLHVHTLGVVLRTTSTHRVRVGMCDDRRQQVSGRRCGRGYCLRPRSHVHTAHGVSSHTLQRPRPSALAELMLKSQLYHCHGDNEHARSHPVTCLIGITLAVKVRHARALRQRSAEAAVNQMLTLRVGCRRTCVRTL
jgi:hypothetical protein